MPDRRLRRRATAVASLALAALSASPATAGQSEGDPAACSPDEVTVVVDFNELGGRTRVACTPGQGTAARLFDAAGFPLTAASVPGMQGFVCRVSGQPADGPCTQGNAYWSLWWSATATGGRSADWSYATLGVDQLKPGPGGYVGFAWHEGDDSVAAPDVALPAGGQVEAEGAEQVESGADKVVRADESDADNTEWTTWLLVGGAVVVLGAATVVPLRRRRREA